MWLDTEPAKTESLLDLLRILPHEEMEMYPVSRNVNWAKNDHPDLVLDVSGSVLTNLGLVVLKRGVCGFPGGLGPLAQLDPTGNYSREQFKFIFLLWLDSGLVASLLCRCRLGVRSGSLYRDVSH